MSTRFIAGQLVDLKSVMTDSLFFFFFPLSNEYNDTERNRFNPKVPEVFFVVVVVVLHVYPHADF